MFDERPEEETQNQTLELESENSNLNLLSISESEEIKESNNNSFFDIGSVSDLNKKLFRDKAAATNDKNRLFDQFFAPNQLDLSDPFNVRPADLVPGKAKPEEVAERAVRKLSEAVIKDERSPEKGKWQHGTDLRALGEYEMFLGRYTEAESHLKESVEILHKELPKQADLPKAEQVLEKACFNYGVALVRPKGGMEDKNKVVAERQEANKYFAETLALSKKLGEPALQQGSILREQLLNRTMLASRHNLQTAEGRADYRKEMQDIIDDSNNGIDQIKDDKTNNGIAHRALLTGDLAFVELSRADALTDQDAVHAQEHFEKAIELWELYNPKTGSANDQQTEMRQISRDTTLMAMLPQYWKLLNLQGNNDRAAQLNDLYQSVVDRLMIAGAIK